MDQEIVPHENDILLGRGGKNNQHRGNEQLRNIARNHKQQYKASSKKEKSSISRAIVQHIRSLNPPGRFLRRDINTGQWVDVGDEIAREKTSQALRDAVSASIGFEAPDLRETKVRRTVSAPSAFRSIQQKEAEQAHKPIPNYISSINPVGNQNVQSIHPHTQNLPFGSPDYLPKREICDQSAKSSTHFVSSSYPPRRSSFEEQPCSPLTPPKNGRAIKTSTLFNVHTAQISTMPYQVLVPESTSDIQMQTNPDISEDFQRTDSNPFSVLPHPHQTTPMIPESLMVKPPYNPNLSQMEGYVGEDLAQQNDSKQKQQNISSYKGITSEHDEGQNHTALDAIDKELLKIEMELDSNHIHDFDFLDDL